MENWLDTVSLSGHNKIKQSRYFSHNANSIVEVELDSLELTTQY